MQTGAESDQWVLSVPGRSEASLWVQSDLIWVYQLRDDRRQTGQSGMASDPSEK